MGKAASEFLATDLGKYIVQRCKEERDAALHSLMKADPEDYKQVRQFQNRAWRAQQFVEWFNELIIEGESALELIKEELGG